MAELTYENLTALRQRILQGKLTIERASSQNSPVELAEALRMTRATIQALVEG